MADQPTPTVVCSVLETDARRAAERLRRAPSECGLVELRGDRLSREAVVAVVRDTERPLIVTVRPAGPGSSDAAAADERRRTLLGALDAGARFVDVELGGPLEDLARGERAERVILSHHAADCHADELRAVYRAMARTRAARLKIVPRASALGQADVVRELLDDARRDGRALACFASGRAGAVTRLLAPAWGSWATYGATAPGEETAEGQFPAADLLRVHDVLGIGALTEIYALVGRAVFASPSPAMHAAGYRHLGLDARYFPVEIDDLEETRPLVAGAGPCTVRGLAVTMPFKQAAWSRCVGRDEAAEASGSVNTVRIGPDGWRGFDTDGPAVLALVRSRLDPRNASVAVVGAGGMARAAAAALARAGARVRLYARTRAAGRAAADAVGAEALPLERLPGARWDVLVQATPLGSAGERVLPAASLTGRLVVDAVYGSATPLVRDAATRGLAALDGFELLVAQAVLQFEHLTDRCVPSDVLRQAGRLWLDARRA